MSGALSESSVVSSTVVIIPDGQRLQRCSVHVCPARGAELVKRGLGNRCAHCLRIDMKSRHIPARTSQHAVIQNAQHVPAGSDIITPVCCHSVDFFLRLSHERAVHLFGSIFQSP